MEERRLLLAVGLSLLVLTGYRFLFTPRHAPARSAPRAVGTPSPAAPRPAAPAPPAAAAGSPAPRPLPSAQPVADSEERRVEVSWPEAEVAFTNRGARLVSWRLRRFLDAHGRPEEMVRSAAEVRPLDLETGDAALDARIREGLFAATPARLVLAQGGTGELRFAFAEGDLSVEKVLRFQPSGLVDVSASVRRAGQAVPVRVVWGPAVGNPTRAEKDVQGYEAPHGVVFTSAAVQRIPPDKIKEPRVLPEIHWIGVESRYFVALLVPPSGTGTGALKAVELPPPPGAADAKPELAPVAAVELGTGGAPAELYVGPKDHSTLSRLGHRLVEVVPVGDWIGPIVVVVMRLVRWIHGHVGNYGWAIVVLTVLINLVMAPLRHYSIANGIKMAKLSPELRVIQERYRGIPALDKRREQMQREMAVVYAKHGMSMGTQMMVGCLPLLITMPFLFAVYRVLQVSVELRGASFLWIPDLSHRDPLFITPVLMGASMFLMQKMMPTTMEPAQQKMMMIMPLALSVMFFGAPAGLNLYWLASNVCSIVQQTVTLRLVQSKDNAKGERRRR